MAARQRAGRLFQRPRGAKLEKLDVYRASIILSDQKLGTQGTKDVIRKLREAWTVKGSKPFLRRANAILKKKGVI